MLIPSQSSTLKAPSISQRPGSFRLVDIIYLMILS